MNRVCQIEVAYATPEKQLIISVNLPLGSTIGEAIQQSGIKQRFPEIDLQHQAVGIFSQLKSLNDLVQEGDRIEIYRPLYLDPKEARKMKAKKK